MKLPRVAAAAVLSMAFAGMTMADDSADAATASGASDSTVMTQTQNTKAQQKQKQQTTKGGRPLNTQSSTTSK